MKTNIELVRNMFKGKLGKVVNIRQWCTLHDKRYIVEDNYIETGAEYSIDEFVDSYTEESLSESVVMFYDMSQDLPGCYFGWIQEGDKEFIIDMDEYVVREITQK